MKFVAALLSFAFVSTNATKNAIGRNRKLSPGHKLPESIKINSKLGGKVMSQARKLDDNDEVDFTWVENYSIKFQGCHHISQWNQDADDEEDVRIATKRLVRFRLCPSDECSLQNAGGCSSGYGEYVIDMNIFLESYIESIEQYNEAKCEYLENMSGCGNDDGDNEDYCVYDYYVSQGMEDICAENNPYKADDDEEEAEQFEIAEYVECAQIEFENDDNRRKLDEEEEVQYYLGPYCAEQGGAIYLGMFTDETCSTFADEFGGKQSYYDLASEELPFGSSNIVSMDCYKCQEPEVQFNYDGDDNEDDDGVSEMCEAVYEQAGKCESNVEYGDNYNACSYIQGIQVIRKNGIIVSAGSKANKTASIFIGLFVVAFVLLSAFVYFLKTKLDRASINLAE